MHFGTGFMKEGCLVGGCWRCSFNDEAKVGECPPGDVLTISYICIPFSGAAIMEFWALIFVEVLILVTRSTSSTVLSSLGCVGREGVKGPSNCDFFCLMKTKSSFSLGFQAKAPVGILWIKLGSLVTSYWIRSLSLEQLMRFFGVLQTMWVMGAE